ncbi:RNA polymerase sigma factor [Methyloferula stellata]|uniref:RNA polymerase sigma factor n=1 Tax=Methyloferula stellata TaxID=876270 RepID=UPI00035CA4EC|nr:RNA polymerase sigma factor [Methyloferula stellata]
MVEPDRSHLAKVLETNYADLRRRLALSVGSLDLATEALHEAYLIVMSKMEIVPRKDSIAYLIRVAVNHLKKKHKKSKRIDDRERDEEVLEKVADKAPSPLQAFLDIEGSLVLADAVRRLPGRRGKIMVAMAFEDRKKEEVAAAFNVTTRTVESELSHAIQECIRELRESGYDVSLRRSAAGKHAARTTRVTNRKHNEVPGE